MLRSSIGRRRTFGESSTESPRREVPSAWAVETRDLRPSAEENTTDLPRTVCTCDAYPAPLSSASRAKSADSTATARSRARRITGCPCCRTAGCEESRTATPSGESTSRSSLTNELPIVSAEEYARSTISRIAGFGTDPTEARSSASWRRTSPSGTSDIGKPGSSWVSSSILRAPSAVATIVEAASTKSESSVAAQYTGATGRPVSFSRASANATADNAFHQVYNGPPKRAGCCPAVTTNPPFAAAASRSAARPVGSSAGQQWSEPIL